MKTRKKYGRGTPGVGVIPDYMPSPSEALAEDSINKGKAKAEGSSNPFAMAVQILGGLGADAAGSGAFANPELAQTDFGQFLQRNNFANGGTATGNDIEVEGDEVIETPGGQVSKVEGPSHEEGGVDLSVPTGSRIYSKRLKVGGKTMAERKEARERKLSNIEKLLDKNKGDRAIANSNSRLKAALAKEEENDLLIQEAAEAFGTMRKFATGTSASGVRPNPFLSKLYGGMPQPNFRTDLPDVPNPDALSLDSPATPPATGTPGTENMSLPEDSTEKPEADNTKLPVSLGDMLAIGGDMFSAFAPLINTQRSRATDSPNINAYKNFGNDALDANYASEDYVQGQKANAQRRLRTNANTAKRQARGSANSINASRAMDLAIEENLNEGQLNADDVFARQMMAIMSERSGLENAQDSAVMQGEYQRDIADRQDKDNYYTQKGKDLSTAGTGIQQIGKDINKIKEQQQMFKMLNQLGEYFKFDKKGNIIGINQG